MKNLFLPKMYIQNYKCLNVDILKKHGIKVLICDIDNTLAPHDILKPSEETKKFIQSIKDAGIEVAIASNNNAKRVLTFTDELGVYAIYSAKKPLPLAYKRICKQFNVKASQVAMLGDQLLTDTFGANLSGCFSILSSPLVMRDIKITRFNRKFEGAIFNYLEKHSSFKKGDYYYE